MLWQGVLEFVTVAQFGSFTQAAKQLGISTAHVSRQISLLEARLNTKLLYRTTRRVGLSEEGELYFKLCRQAITGLEEAEHAISHLQSTPKGHIKLTAPVAYGEQYIMPLVIDFMGQYPDIEVTTVLSNQTLDLVAGGFDLAIRLGKLVDSSMMAKRLTSRTQYVCASKQYLDKHGTPTTLSELKKHNCLVGNSEYWRFHINGQERSVKVSGSLVCNSGYALKDAALKGIGLVKLPDYYIANEIDNGSLVTVLSQFQEAQEGIWALYPHNRHLSPKVRLLVDHLALCLS